MFEKLQRKKSMNLSDEIMDFDIVKFCESQNYDRILYLQLEDNVLLPKECNLI